MKRWKTLSKRKEDRVENSFEQNEWMKKWKVFMRAITNSVGLQVQRMNSLSEQMKEEGAVTGTNNSMKELITWRKLSMIDETNEIKADEFSKVHEDQNHGKAVATGFHGDSSEHEVERLLREDNRDWYIDWKAKIECLAKFITHASIYFNDNNERNKYVRSANMLRKELRGKKIKISRSMNAEERFHHKRMVYIKWNEIRHISQFEFIELALKIRVS